MNAWISSILSVILVSLVSLIGIVTLSLSDKSLKAILLYLVSFSAGAFFGDVFFHILPEISKDAGFGLSISLWILGGVVFSFIIEKIIRWQHCHSNSHIHPVAIMNLFADAV